MTNNGADAGIAMLASLDLISGGQRDAALAHPERRDVGHGANAAEQLVWLVRHRIVAHSQILAKAIAPDPRPGAGGQEQRAGILARVLPELESLAGAMNAQLLDELLHHGLVTENERYRAMQALPAIALRSPGEMLAHLVISGILLEERLNTPGAGWAARPESGVAELSRVVQEAKAWVQELRASSDVEHRVCRPSVWRSIAGLVVVCTLATAYPLYRWLTAVPGCGDKGTVTSIQSMFSGVPRSVSNGSHPRIELSEIRDIGYASAHRQRGCTATVTMNGGALPFAYVVGPLPGKPDRIAVAGANRAIVEARFGKIADDGSFGNQAEPIGREHLESALRAGIEQVSPMRMPVPYNPRKAVEDMFHHVNPERERETADIEPMGACHPSKTGKGVTCRVLIERNDPLLSAFGMPAHLLEADFTFVRDTDAGPWRVSDDFGVMFASAVADARRASLGKSAD